MNSGAIKQNDEIICAQESIESLWTTKKIKKSKCVRIFGENESERMLGMLFQL